MNFLRNVIFVFLAFSCTNEFSLIEEPKEIPIIYGIMDLTDTAQYIRVERAFVDGSTSAFDLALDPNNLYYPNAQVNLIRNSDDKVFNLVQVDGDNEGLPRREGIFAQTPNTLYKIKSDELNLESGQEFTLSVKRDENAEPVTATTTLVDEGNIIRPTGNGRIDFSYIVPTKFRWLAGDNAVLFDLAMLIHYQERDISAGTGFERKVAEWRITNGETVEEIEVDGRKFYEFMNANLNVDPNVVRRFLYTDVILYSGGEEMQNYIAVGQANLGITSSQDIPVFTNLSDGRGLFSSRTRLIKDQIEISPNTLDSLVNGSVTSELNFEI